MKRISLALIATLAGVLASGCDEDGSAAPPPELVDPAASGVGIVAEGCGLVAQVGSGVALGPPGHVVTAAHTIAGTTSITVVDDAGAEHEAVVRAFDPDADLAVVHAPTLDVPSLGLAAASTIGPASVLVWNRDDGVVLRSIDVTRRLSITIEDIYVENTVVRSGIEVSGEIEIGDSGAAVVDSDGDVSGIIYASSRQRGRIGFATDVTEIAGLLADIIDNGANVGVVGVGVGVDNGRCT